MNDKNYKIENHNLIIKDQKSTRQHIKQNDYFGTTATILNLLSQNKFINNTSEIRKILKKIGKEFAYLQKNYEIKKRP